MNDKLVPVIIAAAGIATDLVGLLLKAIEHMKQSGELTPEADKALDDKIARLRSAAHWQLEKPVTPPVP